MSVGNNTFYGWRLIIALFILNLTVTVFFYGGVVANSHMAKMLEMPRSLFGIGFGMMNIISGVGTGLAAIIVNKKGARYSLFVGMIITFAGALMMGTMVRGAWGYIFTFGIIIGTGITLAGSLPVQAVLAQWFVRKRAFATGLVFTSGGVAGVTSPLADKVIQASGGNWHLVWLLIAVFTLIATISVVFVKNAPSDIGQIPDGTVETGWNADDHRGGTDRVYKASEDLSLKQAVRTSALWMILFCGICFFGAYSIIAAHGMIHLMDIGVSSARASMVFAVLAAVRIAGNLIAGFLGDRIEPKYLISFGLMCFLAGSVIIINATSFFRVYLFAVSIGLGFGVAYVCILTILGNYFGAGSVATMLGILSPVGTIFAAASPIAAGMIRDHFGSYFIAFIGAAVCSGAAALVTLFLKPPKVIPE
jgi:cyanate permease